MEWPSQSDRRWTIMPLHFIDVIGHFKLVKKTSGAAKKTSIVRPQVLILLISDMIGTTLTSMLT